MRQRIKQDEHNAFPQTQTSRAKVPNHKENELSY
jgi:hypothetical protein